MSVLICMLQEYFQTRFCDFKSLREQGGPFPSFPLFRTNLAACKEGQQENNAMYMPIQSIQSSHLCLTGAQTWLAEPLYFLLAIEPGRGSQCLASQGMGPGLACLPCSRALASYFTGRPLSVSLSVFPLPFTLFTFSRSRSFF